MNSSSSTSSSQSPYDDNIVINGTFTGSSNGWLLSGGMRYEDNQIVAEPSLIPLKKASQKLPLTVGDDYFVEISLAKTGQSTCSISIGGVIFSFDADSGLLSTKIQAINDDSLVISVIVQSGKTYIDNVSVRKILNQSSSSSSSSQSSYSSVSSSISSMIVKSSSSSTPSSSLSTEGLLSSSQTISLSSSSTSSSFSTLTSTSSSITSQSESHSSESSGSSLSTSSSSSLSSSSIISLSSSSVSSSTLSSDSTFSSKSSSSTKHLSTSSSQTSLSSQSSSDSLFMGKYSIPFRFDVSNAKPIWCFIKHNEHIYAGTGPDGKVLMSQDGIKWDNVITVGDNHVKSMIVWANALFLGTDPNGRVYINNFSTGKFYEAVQTEDACVSSFAVYNNELYAGTKPRGIIYKFDGTHWSRVFNAYSNGINAMIVFQNNLFCFMDNAETAMYFDGKNWKPILISRLDYNLSTSSSSSSQSVSNMSSLIEVVTEKSPTEISFTGLQSETFSSFRKVTRKPFLVSSNSFLDRRLLGDIEEAVLQGIVNSQDEKTIIPQNNSSSLLSACVVNEKMYIGGNNGTIFSYDPLSKMVGTTFQTDLKRVNAIAKLENNIIASIDNVLYIITE